MYKFQRNSDKDVSASPWAIKKTLKGKALYGKRLLNEASTLKNLNHPNIVGYRGLVSDVAGKKCLAMEQCTGSLGDLIEARSENNEGPYHPKNILKVAWDMANALNYLHNTALLLHGDMKSYNILIKGDFVICKLCDFGTSTQLKNDGSGTGVSGSKYIGTVCWSAPEVLIKPQEITTKADIFSLGLVFWEMISLQIPAWEDEDLENKDLPKTYYNIPDRPICRPNLANKDFGSEYNYALELYYCCTSELRNYRPSAFDLMVIIKDMIKDQKYDGLL